MCDGNPILIRDVSRVVTDSEGSSLYIVSLSKIHQAQILPTFYIDSIGTDGATRHSLHSNGAYITNSALYGFMNITLIFRNVQVADNIATMNPLIFNGVAILGVFSGPGGPDNRLEPESVGAGRWRSGRRNVHNS